MKHYLVFDDLDNPPANDYEFWLTKLNLFGRNFINAEVVKAFILSIECPDRFGP